jgi:molybdate transport system ATP-binding protein
MLTVQAEKKLVSTFGELHLQIDLRVQTGERLAIVGASGSGKTTLLRMLAGLTRPDAGQIIFNNQVWFESSKKINLPPQQRSVGLLFQEYALFPNLTVRQNLEYALAKKQSKAIVEELLETVELQNLANRLPHTLSGGQQQRVALARTLVVQPQLLLLDEPLSALDAPLREKLQDFVVKMQEKYQPTLIWVTHNAEEVAKVANRVLMLEDSVLVESPVLPQFKGIPGIIQAVQPLNNQQVITVVVNQNEASFQIAEKIILTKP